MDARFRELEQAWLADPSDAALTREYAGFLSRQGRRDEAARILGIALRAAPERIRETSYESPSPQLLVWRGRDLDPREVEDMVRDDLARLDPALLFDHFPRRRDGKPQLRVTRFLRRYEARSEGYAGQLVLLATTGDSLEPSERRERLIVVELQVRRLDRRALRWFLPPAEWRS